MKDYTRPVIIESNDMFEGVFALESGSPPNIWGWVKWTNQNSGSHSDLEVYVQVASITAEYVKVTLTWVGKGELKVGGFSGPYTNAYQSGNSIVFERQGHVNANETFGFGFNNVVFTDTGDGHIDPEHKGSYYASGTKIGEEAYEFVVDVQCS